MKEKEAGEAPYDERTDSKYSENQIDNKIPKRQNQNEGQKKVINVTTPRRNQKKVAPPPKKDDYIKASRHDTSSR